MWLVWLVVEMILVIFKVRPEKDMHLLKVPGSDGTLILVKASAHTSPRDQQPVLCRCYVKGPQ